MIDLHQPQTELIIEFDKPLVAQNFPEDRTPLKVNEDTGIWEVNSYRIATEIMNGDVVQGGFLIDSLKPIVDKLEGILKIRIFSLLLWTEGEEHKEMRNDFNRFLTPRRIEEKYMEIVKNTIKDLAGRFSETNIIDVSNLTANIALKIVAELFGFDQSDESFDRISRIIANQGETLKFLVDQILFIISIRKSSKARVVTPEDDILTSLIEKENLLVRASRGLELVGAGVATTREFMQVVLRIAIDYPVIYEIITGDNEALKEKLLYQILRIQPIVQKMYRFNKSAITLKVAGQEIIIPPNSKIQFNISSINTDPEEYGESAKKIDTNLGRKSFSFGGNSPHHCIGEALAIKETSAFITTILREIKGRKISVKSEPEQFYNDKNGNIGFINFMIELSQ